MKSKFSARRTALALSILAALWDGYWIAPGLAKGGPNASGSGVLWAVAAAHVVSLAAFLIPRPLWLGAGLLGAAAALAWAGTFYFYVVWPGAAALLAAALLAFFS